MDDPTDNRQRSRPWLSLFGIELHFDGRGFVTVLVIGALVLSGWLAFRNKIQADEAQGAAQYALLVQGSVVQKVYSITKNGNLTDDRQRVVARFHRYPNRDELRYVIVNGPGRQIDTLQATVNLAPDYPASKAKLNVITRAVGYKQVSVQNESTTIFLASFIDPKGTVTLVIAYPRGTIQLTRTALWFDLLVAQPGLLWADVGLGLMLLGAVTTVVLGRRRIAEWRAMRKAGVVQSSPPMTLPPAVVGVLVRQKLTNRDIMATLIDLANRGYLAFIENEQGMVIVPRRRGDMAGLYPYEVDLLRIVGEGEAIYRTINQETLQTEAGHFIVEAYGLVERLGAFVQNPRQTHLRWRANGASLLLAGVIGLLVTLRLFPDPPYVALFWIGVTAIGIMIFELGGGYTPYTLQGREVVAQWLSFGRYLAQGQVATYGEVTLGSFTEYLPYALVLGVEEEWIKRFEAMPFRVPAWFTTREVGLDIQSFSKHLLVPARAMSTLVTSMVTPTVD